MQENIKLNKGFLSHIALGTIASSLVVSAIYPLDQTLSTNSSNFLSIREMSPRLKFVPQRAIELALYDHLQSRFADTKASFPLSQQPAFNVGIGAIVGGISAFVLHPITRAQSLWSQNVALRKAMWLQQLEGPETPYRNPLDMCRGVGLRGLFKNFSIPNTLSHAVFCGVYFGGYDSLQLVVRREDNFAINFCLGLASTAFAIILRAPFYTLQYTDTSTMKFFNTLGTRKLYLYFNGRPGINPVAVVSGAAVLATYTELKKLFIT